MSQLLGNKDGTGPRIVREWHNPNLGYFYITQTSLYQGQTPFQKIELVQTPHFGNVLLLDNVTQVAEKGEWQYHEPLAHYPLLAHPEPRDVLVIGGGDGGTLREVVRHSCVQHVDYVDLDEQVVAFARKYLGSIHQNAFDDPRVHIHFGDGRAFVEKKQRTYDVIIMDMTDPFGPSCMLYTQEFFRAIKNSMNDEHSLFSMHSESPLARPVAFECIHRTLASVFNLVRPAYTFVEMYATLWSFVTASMKTDIASLSAEEINRRIQNRNIPPLQLITGETWKSMQVEYPYIHKIHGTDVPIITDAHPDFPDHFPQESIPNVF